MSLSAALLALLALQSDVESLPELEFRFPSAGEVERDLRACGFANFSVTSVEATQSGFVKIVDPDVSDAQLQCAFDASDNTFYLFAWEEPIGTRFNTMRGEILLERAKSRAQAFFRERSLLQDIPIRESGEEAIDFARRLERLCGPTAKGFFAEEYGTLTISSEWLAEGDLQNLSEPWACVMHASALVGIPIGFIGNEKAPAENEENK